MGLGRVLAPKIPGWHDRALYPLAGGAARRRISFWHLPWPRPPSYGVDVTAGGLHRQGDGSRTCARSEILRLGTIRALYPLAGRRRAPPDFFWHLPWPPSYGVDVTAGGLHRQGDGSRTCARSEIPGLARSRSLSVGGAAPRAAGFLFGICHGRRATGSTSPPAACTGKVMGLGRVLAPKFQAGTIALFIRWPGGAARRRISFWHLPWPPSYGVDVTAGGLHRQGDGSRTCARSKILQAGTIALFIRWRGGAARRRISFWHLPWPPSYGVDVTAGGLHRQGDGSRTCARSRFSGWHDRALYPLAGRRRAPPDFFLAFAMAAELRGERHRRRLAPEGDGSRTCARSEIPGWHDRALYPLAGGAARRRISFWHLPWPPSYGVDVTAGGLHRQGDGSRTCARSGRFQAGTIALFIRWRGGAARRRISFWHLPWPPSYGVDVTAGGLHRQGDGPSDVCSLRIPGWHDRALYPLAGRRPRRRISFWHLPWPPSYGVDVTAGGLHRQGDGSRTCARSKESQAGTIALFIRWRAAPRAAGFLFLAFAMAAELRGRRHRRRLAPAR